MCTLVRKCDLKKKKNGCSANFFSLREILAFFAISDDGNGKEIYFPLRSMRYECKSQLHPSNAYIEIPFMSANNSLCTQVLDYLYFKKTPLPA